MQSRAQELESVMYPVADAYGLPNAYYVNPEQFEAEKKQVFDPNWFCLGFGKDVANAGDVYPVDFAGLPFIITRDRDNTVRVFNNVCRHRGMRLIDEPTNIIGVIRCPYHSWCYKLDGRLFATPHVGGAGHNTHKSVDRSKHGLIEVRSHVWMDMVFVNLSGEAPAFSDYASQLFERWNEFVDKPIYHSGQDSSFSLSLKCNWKLAVENYCESYHLPWIHPSLNSYSRLQDHYNIVQPQAYAGQGTLVYNPKLDDSGRQFSHFEGLSEKWNQAAEYIALFPNVLLGIHRDHFFAIQITPNSAQESTERIEIYYASETMTRPEWANLREKNTRMWKVVFKEDIFVVEGMQKGRHAPGFDGGKFSPAMDPSTHCFNDWVARQWLT